MGDGPDGGWFVGGVVGDGTVGAGVVDAGGAVVTGGVVTTGGVVAVGGMVAVGAAVGGGTVVGGCAGVTVGWVTVGWVTVGWVTVGWVTVGGGTDGAGPPLRGTWVTQDRATSIDIARVTKARAAPGARLAGRVGEPAWEWDAPLRVFRSFPLALQPAGLRLNNRGPMGVQGQAEQKSSVVVPIGPSG